MRFHPGDATDLSDTIIEFVRVDMLPYDYHGSGSLGI
jgi:hypothetical protein